MTTQQNDDMFLRVRNMPLRTRKKAKYLAARLIARDSETHEIFLTRVPAIARYCKPLSEMSHPFIARNTS